MNKNTLKTLIALCVLGLIGLLLFGFVKINEKYTIETLDTPADCDDKTNCGKSYTRTVTCYNKSKGQITTDLSKCPQPVPKSTASCPPCDYEWNTVNATCSDKTCEDKLNNTVICVNKTTGATMSDTRCAGKGPKPSSQTTCPACTYEWQEDSWKQSMDLCKVTKWTETYGAVGITTTYTRQYTATISQVGDDCTLDMTFVSGKSAGIKEFQFVISKDGNVKHITTSKDVNNRTKITKTHGVVAGKSIVMDTDLGLTSVWTPS